MLRLFLQRAPRSRLAAPLNPLRLRPFHVSSIALRKPSTAKSKTKQPQREEEQEDDAEEEDASSSGKKGKRKPILASELIPASQMKVSPEAKVECDKIETKMHGSVAYYQKEMSLWEGRALGRVTPAILDGVRVSGIPDMGDEAVKLTDIAAVGVKEGTVLVVTAYDDSHLKFIEKAIHASQAIQTAPQKVDARTLRLPMPKPTFESRAAFVKTASKSLEDTKVKIRTMHSAGLKVLTKMGYDKKTKEFTEMQAITDKAVGEVDKIFERFKKEMAA